MDNAITRRTFTSLLAGLAASPAFASESAAAWPSRPVRIVVPFGPGGAVDTLVRGFGQHFPEFANGQPLVVENRPGAGGLVAGSYVSGQHRMAIRCSRLTSVPMPSARN